MKIYQVWALESGDTNAVTLIAHALERAQNKNGVQQGGSTMGVALNYISITTFW